MRALYRFLTALSRLLRSWFLRWCIWETEHYLSDCARDGLHDSLMLREFRGQLADMRVRLALLQEPAAICDPARAKGARKPGPNCEQRAAAAGGPSSGA